MMWATTTHHRSDLSPRVKPLITSAFMGTNLRNFNGTFGASPNVRPVYSSGSLTGRQPPCNNRCMDWYRCRFLESSDNLRPLIKERFGREPSAKTSPEIIACLQQGRLFYEGAENSPLEIRPLQLFYGMVGFAKALIVARNLCSLSSLQRSHGVRDISAANTRIADLRVRINSNGTFAEFNDVVAELTRFCYSDASTNRHTISLPSAKSAEMVDIELSLREVLGRIPELESLYRMNFKEGANCADFWISNAHHSETAFDLQIQERRVFTSRESLRQIVERWRARFPFLNLWRLDSAENNDGNAYLHFGNVRNEGGDEFSESSGECSDGSFQASRQPDDDEKRFTLDLGLPPTAGYLRGGTSTTAPIGNSGLYVSEFSLHYLGLFLLSSLVRYRPEAWAHSISRSIIPNETADDQALSLIERFLEINRNAIPEMVATVLNPHDDYFYG